MPSISRVVLSAFCLVMMSSPVVAQVTFDIAPGAYTIQRFPNADVVDIIVPAPATLTGGDTVNIRLRLPQPLGIDLGQASTFTTRMEFLHPAVCGEGPECRIAPPFFNDLPASVGYYTAAGEPIPAFSTNVWVGARAATLVDDATQLALAGVERTDSEPFNSQFGSLSDVRVTIGVPSYYETTPGLQLTVSFIAERGSPGTAPLLVQGEDVGILQVVAATVAALQEAGIDAATVLALAEDLRAALEAIAAGDYAAGARQLNTFFNDIDALVDAGVLPPTEARQLRPTILKEAASLRSP